MKGWELMVYCLSVFPPSKHLKNFLQAFIDKNMADDTRPQVQALAKYCNERMPVIVKMGQRKQVPSKVELECLKKMQPVPIKINLISGEQKTFTVDSYTLVSDVNALMAKKQNLVCDTPFALYESAGDNGTSAHPPPSIHPSIRLCCAVPHSLTHSLSLALSSPGCGGGAVSRAHFGPKGARVGCARVVGKRRARRQREEGQARRVQRRQNRGRRRRRRTTPILLVPVQRYVCAAPATRYPPPSLCSCDEALLSRADLCCGVWCVLWCAAKLVLKTSDPDVAGDSEAVNLIYLQAVHDVVTWRYPVQEKDITVLGALQLQASYGNYKEDTNNEAWTLYVPDPQPCPTLPCPASPLCWGCGV